MAWKGNARLNPRRDGNEKPIIDALRAQGFHVVQINGKGVPDLLVSKRCQHQMQVRADGTVAMWTNGFCWLVEVKTPKGKSNAAQLAFRQSWQGPPVITLRTVEDAMRFPLLVCEHGA